LFNNTLANKYLPAALVALTLSDPAALVGKSLIAACKSEIIKSKAS